MRTLILAVALVLAGALGQPAGAEEAIRSYDQTVTIDPSDSLDVTERITVSAEGDQIRRGIYRDFPTVFIDETGARRQVGFEVVEVLKDGVAESYSVNRTSAGVRIYIGQEDVFLQPRDYTYTLRYRTSRQMRRFSDRDELYWNVTGNEWAFPIDRASVRVELPGGARVTDFAAYTGPLGAQGRDFTVSEGGTGAGVIGFRTTRRLAPGEGLTVAVAMPAGTLAEPDAAMRAAWFWLDHRGTILGLAGLAVVLAYYLVSWSRVGRDPPKGTIIPLFEPPAGISAPLAHYIHERGLSGWTALSASWISLAVRGLVTLTSDGGRSLTITRTDATAPAGLAKGERALFDWIDRRGPSMKIDRSNGPSIQRLSTSFREAVKGESRETFFNNNRVYSVLGVLLSLAVIVAAAALGADSPEAIASLFPFVFAGIFGTIGFSGLARVGSRTGIMDKLGGLVTGLVGTGAALAAVGTSAFIAIEAGSSWILPATAAILVGINILFYHLMSAPTANGRAVMDKIEGLILYMTVAEEKRLNMPGLPPVTPSRFETLLPYAVALGVEKPWSDALESELARSAAADTQERAYQPSWYRGSAFSRPADIGRSLSAMAGTFQSAVPPPKSSSSGSSGGGSSGGGGGGGGGGGW